LVIYISFLFIDGGKTILVIDNNVQILLHHNQNCDLEIPHQHNLNIYDDDDKWVKSNSFELLYSYSIPVPLLYHLIKSTEDYAGSVWQPPKSV
jgi:hypothetical protein